MNFVHKNTKKILIISLLLELFSTKVRFSHYPHIKKAILTDYLQN